MQNYKNSPWVIASAVLWAVAAIGVVFGFYTAFFYDGVIPHLIPFSAASLVGALVSVSTLATKKPHPVPAVVGLLLMALAPTGFFWIGNIAALVGAVVCGIGFHKATAH
ncbi:MAG: hypothetical protein Q4E03_05795 [Trueperella sp.]|nr:hypothetical protein [Trueperella sp.]